MCMRHAVILKLQRNRVIRDRLGGTCSSSAVARFPMEAVAFTARRRIRASPHSHGAPVH